MAMVGALVLALPLAACGRKGSLDPPPGGHRIDSGEGRTPVSQKGEAPPREKQPDYDEDGRPIAPEGSKKKLPVDWLID